MIPITLVQHVLQAKQPQTNKPYTLVVFAAVSISQIEYSYQTKDYKQKIVIHTNTKAKQIIIQNNNRNKQHTLLVP